jgi:hypothetical protein
MKNRLKLYFESERKPALHKDYGTAKNLKQYKLITLHTALVREMEDADITLKGHYEILLICLKLLVDAYGPYEWKVKHD